MDYAFGPAADGEPIVHGACRPGYGTSEPSRDVGPWIEFVRDRGIERVCCLLDEELDRYDDLLGRYREAFGTDRVVHAPVTDYTVLDPGTFHDRVLPFLTAADDRGEPVVVHCSAGSGRTGQVLVGWLVCGRGRDLDGAIAAVEATGRDPLEAVERDDLADLFAVCL